MNLVKPSRVSSNLQTDTKMGTKIAYTPQTPLLQVGCEPALVSFYGFLSFDSMQIKCL